MGPRSCYYLHNCHTHSHWFWVRVNVRQEVRREEQTLNIVHAVYVCCEYGNNFWAGMKGCEVWSVISVLWGRVMYGCVICKYEECPVWGIPTMCWTNSHWLTPLTVSRVLICNHNDNLDRPDIMTSPIVPHTQDLIRYWLDKCQTDKFLLKWDVWNTNTWSEKSLTC